MKVLRFMVMYMQYDLQGFFSDPVLDADDTYVQKYGIDVDSIKDYANP